MRDLTPREWALMVPTIALAVFMGVFPSVFLRPMEPSVNRVIDRVVGRQPAQVSLTPPGSGVRGPGSDVLGAGVPGREAADERTRVSGLRTPDFGPRPTAAK
jgi:hypothetical protein